MTKNYIMYETMESVVILNNTSKNLEKVKGKFEYELLDREELYDTLIEMEMTETHFIMENEKIFFINDTYYLYEYAEDWMNEKDYKYLEDNGYVGGETIITSDDLPKEDISVYNCEFDEIIELKYVMSLTDGSMNKVYKIKIEKSF